MPHLWRSGSTFDQYPGSMCVALRSAKSWANSRIWQNETPPRQAKDTMKLLALLFLSLLGLSSSCEAADLRLIDALIQVESSGRDHVVGDNGSAAGPLQVHTSVVADVNRLYGTKYTHREMHDRAKAIEVCSKYLSFYGSEKRLGRPPTMEDLARIWNGGPQGWRRSATLNYWQKVKRHL